MTGYSILIFGGSDLLNLVRKEIACGLAIFNIIEISDLEDINSLPVGFYVTDHDGSLIYANDTLKTMLNVKSMDKINTIDSYVNPEDQTH